MENSIIIPDNRFDFSKLRLVEPVSIQGGTYFTKLYNGNESLYIQTPRGSSKQGFIKSSRKIYNDLLFNKDNEQFIQWILDLESQCVELLYNYSADWFQSPLEMEDIENAFNTILKLNKTNEYVIRSNVKVHTMTKEPVIKVYNQSETPLSMEHVTKNVNIITIMEIVGIRFTSKSFQLETEMKQVMVLDKDIFDNCLIKPILPPTSSLGQTNDNFVSPRLVEETIDLDNNQKIDISNNLIPEETLINEDEEKETESDALENFPIQDLSLEVDEKTKEVQKPNHVEFLNVPDSEDTMVEKAELENEPIKLDFSEVTDLDAEGFDTIVDDSDEEFEDENDDSGDESDQEEPLPKLTFGDDTILSNIQPIQSLGEMDSTDILKEENAVIEEKTENQNLEEETNENIDKDEEKQKTNNLVESIIEEVSSELTNTDELQDFTDKELNIGEETITLKKPDQHYYELFEKVRNEAKQAKKRAKEAYLKAKNIKKSYMLETMSDSSDDSLNSLDESDQETELNLE